MSNVNNEDESVQEEVELVEISDNEENDDTNSEDISRDFWATRIMVLKEHPGHKFNS